MAEYTPDTGLKMLKGRLGAVLVILITQILTAKFGVTVDDSTNQMILELSGIIIELVGLAVASAMASLSKYLEMKKLKG